MHRNGFLKSLLNLIVVVSLLMGMLPLEVRAVSVVEETAAETHPVVEPQAAPTPEPQARTADTMIYLPLVVRNYAGLSLEISLNQYAYPWLLLPGDFTTYTLVMENPETYALASGELTAGVPDGVTLVDGSVSDAGVYDAQAQQIRWTLPELAGGTSLTVTFQAQVTASAPLTTSSLAQVTGTMQATRVVTASDPAYISVGEASVQTLEPGGGTLTTPDSLATLVAPAGAVTQSTEVQVSSFAVPYGPEDSLTTWFAFFELSATGAAGEALQDAEGHTHFLQPLTLTMDLETAWLEPYLVHITGPMIEDHEIHFLDYPHTTSLITATLQDFSTWGAAGANPYPDAGTHYLMTNQADTDLFSGAATYNYNLDLPAGRNGLAPDLSLNYSSGAANGVRSAVQSGDVGFGWNLGGRAEIVRNIITYHHCYEGRNEDCGTIWAYRSLFNLVIGGASYHIYRDESSPTGNGCRYIAENGPGLKVMRYTAPGASNQYCGYPAGGSEPPNRTKEYWEVTTGDGTVYRLGYYGKVIGHPDHDSEQITPMDGYTSTLQCTLDSCQSPSKWYTSFKGYAGESTDSVAYRWSVDQVQDVYGNTIEYGYLLEDLGVFGDHNEFDLRWCDRAQHLDWIRYTANPSQGVTGAYLVDVVLEQRTTVNDNGGAIGPRHDDGLDSRISLYYDLPWSMWDSLRVDKIVVCEENGTHACAAGDPLLVEYDLDYEFIDEIQPWFPLAGMHHATTRLKTITRQDSSGGTVTQLPPVTFDYGAGGIESFPQFYCRDRRNDNCVVLRYPRLLSVDNGYSGLIEFEYNTIAQEEEILFRDGDEPGAYSFRVKQKRVHDGMGNTTVVDYAYESPCFSVLQNRTGSCLHPTDMPNYGLVGHAVVTQTAYEAATPATILAKSAHHFHTQVNAWQYRGRQSQSQVFDSDGSTVLQQTDTQWTHELVGPAIFAYASSQSATDYTGATPLTTRAEYQYDPAYQGETQHGLLTHVMEYDSQNTRQRIDFTYYVVDEDNWLLLPWVKNIFDGSWSWKTAQFYLYDGNTDPYSQVLTKGALTLERTLVVDQATCPMTDRSVDASYAYDVYGNLVSTTTYAGYGQMRCVGTTSEGYWEPVGDPGGGSEARVSTINYDTQQHTFPVETCAAVGTPQQQCSGVEYYGVNGDATDCPISDGYFGAVCREWGPNGSPTDSTHYHYDAFGRKTLTWLPGENVAHDPSQRIDYFDITQPEWHPTLVSIWTRYNSEPDDPFYDENTTLWQRVFYDGLGRQVQEHSRTADWEYLHGVVPEDGPGHDIVQDTHYNGLGQVAAQSVPYSTTRYIYDPDDPADSYSTPDPNQPQTLTDYDALGRVVQVTNPDGTTATTSYSGRTITAVDANGHQMRQTLDDFGRMVQVEEFTGQAGVDATLYATTHYAYDIVDNLTAVTDTVGNVTTMDYDGLGRKQAMSDPDMGVWSYGYSPAGSLITQTDAIGCMTTFTYDPLERLTGKSYSGACSQPAVSYSYDEGGGYNTGMRTGMTYDGGSASYAYDVRGRAVRSTQTLDGIDSYTTTYAYDDVDRLVSTTYPDGEVVEMGYDNAGYPVTTTGHLNYVTGTSYNELGLTTEMTLGNGTQTTWTYWGLEAGSASTDNYGRLAQIQVHNSGASLLMDRQYDYDNVGNVTRQTDMTDDMAFTYDALNRLVGAAPAAGGTGYNAAYTYDSIGNLTHKQEGPAGGLDYSYTSPKPHAVTLLSDGSSFAYDANGNQITRALNGGETYTQSYDAENRLTVVTETVSGAVTRFIYDGNGARVAQVTDAGTTVYVGEIYEEFHEAGSSVVTTTKYYYLGSQRVAMSTEGTVRYLHSDHLGSTSLTTDQSGAVVSKQRYYPYGGVRDAQGTTPTDFGFTGQRLDDSTGLMYYKARYYDASLGRFAQADTMVPQPGNPQALNRYSYVLNNPLRYTDPTGHFTRDEIIQYLENHGKSYDEAREIVAIWERSDAHTDWWNVLMKAQVGDRIEGVDARNPDTPFKRTNKRVYGYFTQGKNAPFDFLVASGKFNNDLSAFYSDNPADRYANTRVDIILGRPTTRNINVYDFVAGTDNFDYKSIPKLAPPSDNDAIKGVGAVAGGIIAIPSGWVASPLVGIPSSAAGVAAVWWGYDVITDYLYALNIYNYQEARFADYGPGNP